MSVDTLANDRDRVSRQSYADKMREAAARNMYAFHPASDPNVASQPRKAGIAALEPQVDPTVTPAQTEEANNVAEPTVTPDKTEEAKQPSFYSKFLQMTTPPVSAEEQARRTKAATAARGIGELGNALSALSNLTFAGVAPSQTLPSTEKIGADITSWQDKLKAERERYQQRGLEAIARDYEIAYRAAKDKEARELADRTFNEQMRQFNESLSRQDAKDEYQRNQDAIKNAQEEKRIRISQQNANTASKNADTRETTAQANQNYRTWKMGGGGNSKNWRKPVTSKDADGNEYTLSIDTSMLDPMNLQQIVDTLPEELKSKHKLTGSVLDDMAKQGYDDRVAMAVGEAIKEYGGSTYNLMSKLGLIVEEKSLEAAVKNGRTVVDLDNL